MQIKRLDSGLRDAWDRFVQNNERASFFHLAGWRDVVEQTFGWPTYYLYAEDDLGIQGVLPLAHVKSRLFGNALISAPYAVYGGIVAASEDARSALDEAAVELSESLGVDYLELRQR
ncbi:MAG: FemAB family XrtA/PEP-CTERM system-associated protein, partial [Gammaproteobacteria bacterium]